MSRPTLPLLAALGGLFALQPLHAAPAPIPTSRSVQTAVSFAVVDDGQIDDTGINFDFVPLPKRLDQQPKFLPFVTGERAVQLLRTFSRAHEVAAVGSITAFPNKVVSVLFVAEAPNLIGTALSAQQADRAYHRLKRPRLLQVGVSLRPRINGDNSVTLVFTPYVTEYVGQGPDEVMLSLGHSRAVTTRAVKSGSTLAFVVWLQTQAVVGAEDTIQAGVSLPKPGSGRRRFPAGQELVLFLTPTFIQ